MSTYTTEGEIPDLRIRMGDVEFDAPVCVRIQPRGRDQECVQIPIRTVDGELMYALPGGRRCYVRGGRIHLTEIMT